MADDKHKTAKEKAEEDAVAAQHVASAKAAAEEGPIEVDRSVNETVPGGAYIRGGKPGRDGKHYGGQVVDCDGQVILEVDDKHVNPGKDVSEAVLKKHRLRKANLGPSEPEE